MVKTRGIGTSAIVAIIFIVAIAGIGGYFVLKGGEEIREGEGEEGVPAPAEFEVSNLTFYPSEVEVGESVTISATVKNVGDLEGTYTVELKIDGEIQETKDITLAGGETRTVSFTVSKNEAKSYSVLVDGLTGSFTVKKPQPEWVYVTTFTAMTDYWYSTWLDLQSEPWNRPPDEFIDYYYSLDEQFTDYFNIQGNKFKIEYHVAGDYEDGISMAFTYPEGTDILYVDARAIFTGTGTITDANQSGTYIVEEGPGTYYIVVTTEYIDYWTIDIYDWRGGVSGPISTPTPTGENLTLEVIGDGIAEWTTEVAHSGDYSIKLTIPETASTSSWAIVKVPYGGALSTLEPHSCYCLYTAARPRFALYLDKTGNGEVDSRLLSDYLDFGSGEWIVGIGGFRWGWTEWTEYGYGNIWRPYDYWQNLYSGATVLYVAVALEYWAAEPEGIGVPLYVDDITINGVTYDLEPS